MHELAEKIDCTGDMERKMSVIEALVDFIHLDPELPDVGTKTFTGPGPIEIKPGATRDEIRTYLAGLRETHTIADLAFYASRDLAATHWGPFLKAGMERNPVVIEATADLSDDALIQTLENLENESIYDGSRVAQPDEVWNFQRGDGVEKAIALSNVWKARHPEASIQLEAAGEKVEVSLGSRSVEFTSAKELTQTITL
jgi:hypothetical protein